MSKTQFGPSYSGHYPEEMRTQLWPLCCGARILSGFKATQLLTEEALVKQIKHTIDEMIPDHQVYGGETMKPKLVFLTLNSSQMSSKKIMDAIAAVGFKKFAEGAPRGSAQGFFILDLSGGTFKTYDVSTPAAAAA